VAAKAAISPSDSETNAAQFALVPKYLSSKNPEIPAPSADSGRGDHLAGDTKFCILLGVADCKPVEFRGSSLEDLRAFPLTARREAGHQLDQVQNGREPDDWKPMNTVGQGVKEIRIRDEAGAFRVLYVAKFAHAIYVLHCFQKKTEKTSKADVELAAKRYRELLKEREQ
jgi:phage-related protein